MDKYIDITDSIPNECADCMLVSSKHMINNEKLLRKLLWLNHGCSITSLYGDDGEMQCSKCLIDFKRNPVEDIEKRIYILNIKKGD